MVNIPGLDAEYLGDCLASLAEAISPIGSPALVTVLGDILAVLAARFGPPPAATPAWIQEVNVHIGQLLKVSEELRAEQATVKRYMGGWGEKLGELGAELRSSVAEVGRSLRAELEELRGRTETRLEDMERWRSGTMDPEEYSVESELRQLREDVDTALARTK